MKPSLLRIERINTVKYGQFLLSSPKNRTMTYYADHADNLSHDSIKHFLEKEDLPLELIWDNVNPGVIQNAYGYLLFDDTVLDKRYSRKIELVR